MCEVVGESYFPVSCCVFVWCAFCLVRDLMGWGWSRRRREKRARPRGARLLRLTVCGVCTLYGSSLAPLRNKNGQRGVCPCMS